MTDAALQFPVVSAGADLAATRALFEEYAASLPIKLCFQQFDQELATLPGAYTAPRGTLILCRCGGVPAGCVGLRPFDAATGELKRLYVVPRFRGHGIARELITRAIATARAAGYHDLVLDTLASMQPAIRLYESFRFRPTAPYYDNPNAAVHFFRLQLEPAAEAAGS